MSPAEELNLLMRVANLEERLAIAERFIHTLAPLLPQIEAGCAQAIQHAVRLSADLQDRANEQAAILEKLDELRECIDQQGETLQGIIEDFGSGEEWKRGGESPNA